MLFPKLAASDSIALPFTWGPAMPRSQHQVTHLLKAWADGDETAKEMLVPLVYSELHRMARRYMARETPGNCLQPTALIHEAFLRLLEAKNIHWQNRAHFFAISARIMRRILVEHARARHCAKRGGNAQPVNLDEAIGFTTERARDLIALDDALNSLAKLDPRQSQLVELRFFGGLTLEETGVVLGLSPRTVRREWSMARAWLYRALHPQ
jgi:RNA polymerase sigma-70 factor, ECF subfamily